MAEQFTVTDFGAIATPLISMNLDTWNSLPPEVQTIFLEEGEAWNQKMGTRTGELQEKAIETMRELGVRIYELSDEQKQEWAARLPNIPAERTAEIEAAGQPSEAVYRYIELLAEDGHVFPRDWLAER